MKISRRTWLKGAFSTTLALPMLEYFGAGTAAAQAGADAKPRLLVYYLPNGRVPDWWVPVASGDSLTFPTEASALQPFASRALSVVNLDNIAAKDSPGAAHAMGTSTVLSGVRFPDLSGLKCNITLDQLIANELDPQTRFRSLQFSAGEPGTCDVGGSACPYTQCISWAGPGQPLIPTINPATAFEQLFDTSVDGLVGPAAEVRRKTRRSLLDFVKDDAATLQSRLGAADKMRLDEYFTSVREVEKTLTQDTLPASCVLPAEGPGGTLAYPDRVEAFHDLLSLAFQCDQTRIASFMIEFGLSQRSHEFLNAPGQHHALSHNDPEQLRRVETWQAEKVASMLTRLRDTPDVDGTSLLDNTLVLVMPSMGIGTIHDHGNVCPSMFGGQSIVQTTGKRVTATGRPMNDFHAALLEAYGIAGSFGRDGSIFGDYGNSRLAGVKA